MLPDPELVEAIATDLGVDPSFVEKDWYAIRLVATVAGVREGNLTPVFSGGTSLSKGYGLIRRFSEDLDFKILLPEAGTERSARRSYRRAVVDAIRADDDWTLREEGVEAGNESRFFRCHVGYPTTSAVAAALRPQLQLEMTFARPVLAPEHRSLRSFVAEARREDPEVPRIGCVAPAETAADKISALTWRILDPNARQDPTLIRHVYDVAALEPHAVEHEDFPELLRELLNADAERGAPDPDLLGRTPNERLVAALDVLSGREHAAQYERFVGAMCYGAENETPKYQDALEAVRRLGMRAAPAGGGTGLWNLIEARRKDPTVSMDELQHRADREQGAVRQLKGQGTGT